MDLIFNFFIREIQSFVKHDKYSCKSEQAISLFAAGNTMIFCSAKRLIVRNLQYGLLADQPKCTRHSERARITVRDSRPGIQEFQTLLGTALHQHEEKTAPTFSA